MFSATMIWLATLQIWPVPASEPTWVIVLAHQLEQRLGPRECGIWAADHDRQRRLLGADFTARDRSVEILDSPFR